MDADSHAHHFRKVAGSNGDLGKDIEKEVYEFRIVIFGSLRPYTMRKALRIAIKREALSAVNTPERADFHLKTSVKEALARLPAVALQGVHLAETCRPAGPTALCKSHCYNQRHGNC